jgi:hypothetical protein
LSLTKHRACVIVSAALNYFVCAVNTIFENEYVMFFIGLFQDEPLNKVIRERLLTFEMYFIF